MEYYVNVVAKRIYAVGGGLAFNWVRNKQGNKVWVPVCLYLPIIVALTNIGPLSKEDLRFYCEAAGIKVPEIIIIQDDGWDGIDQDGYRR